ESAGMEAPVSVPAAGQTSIAVAAKPAAARRKCFPEKILIFCPLYPSAWRLPAGRRSLRFSNLPPGNARVKHLVSAGYRLLIGDEFGFHILARRRRQHQADHASRLHRRIVPHPARRRWESSGLP